MSGFQLNFEVCQPTTCRSHFGLSLCSLCQELKVFLATTCMKYKQNVVCCAYLKCFWCQDPFMASQTSSVAPHVFFFLLLATWPVPSFPQTSALEKQFVEPKQCQEISVEFKKLPSRLYLQVQQCIHFVCWDCEQDYLLVLDSCKCLVKKTVLSLVWVLCPYVHTL